GRFIRLPHHARKVHLVKRTRVAKMPARITRRLPNDLALVGLALGVVPRPEHAYEVLAGDIFFTKRVRQERGSRRLSAKHHGIQTIIRSKGDESGCWIAHIRRME